MTEPNQLKLPFSPPAKLDEIQILNGGFVRLVEWMGDDNSIVQAARVSYGKGSKGEEQDRKLIKYLLQNNHTSPFEQVVLKFHVKAPLFVFRQWHRHRTWSYNEISARYTEMKDEFYLPTVWRKQAKNNKQGSEGEIETPFEADFAYGKVLGLSTEIYRQLLSMGVAREQARMVLPVSIYSEMYATVNLHNLLRFLILRDSSHAQYEIREYAKALKELTRQICPVTIELFEELHRND